MPNTRIVEMFHGATGAFKDLALSVLGAVLDHFLEKRKKRAIVRLHSPFLLCILPYFPSRRLSLVPQGTLAQLRLMRSLSLPPLATFHSDVFNLG